MQVTASNLDLLNTLKDRVEVDEVEARRICKRAGIELSTDLADYTTAEGKRVYRRATLGRLLSGATQRRVV